MQIIHPIGNLKIFVIKKCRAIINFITMFFLSFILKINKKESEIIISTSFYAPWKNDKKFFLFYNKIKHLTLLDNKRLFTLWYLANDLKNVSGDIFDVGCLQGGAGLLMSKANNKGSTYLFDTFEGFKEEEKFHKKKHFIFKDLDFVKNEIKTLKLKNTKVIKCKFPNNLKKSIKGRKIKLCHLDVNTYKSTKESFNYIEKKLVKNGIIVFDDYGIYGADSIKKFINSILKKYNKKFTFIYNFMGQCILIKKNT